MGSRKAEVAVILVSSFVTISPVSSIRRRAANVLKMSRSYVAGLLEKGDMPFRKAGVQRRVPLDAGLNYKVGIEIGRTAAFPDVTHFRWET